MARKAGKSEPKLINASELARRFGVSEAAVRKAVAAGRIVPDTVDYKGRKWFSEKRVRAQWRKNTEPERPTGEVRVEAPVEDTPLPSTGKLTGSREESVKVRTMRDAAQARILVFKAKSLEKELVDAHEITRIWVGLITEAKRQLLALPVDIRMRIPTLTNDDMALMESRIVQILTSLSEWKLEGEK